MLSPIPIEFDQMIEYLQRAALLLSFEVLSLVSPGASFCHELSGQELQELF